MLNPHQKRLKKELLELTQFAYEREMAMALKRLDAYFEQWKLKKITAIELSEKIHRFHQDDARDLWTKYVPNTFHDLLVASAIHRGVIDSEEVTPELLEFLQPKIKLYAEDQEE